LSRRSFKVDADSGLPVRDVAADAMFAERNLSAMFTQSGL
jgi:hypothetical protein